MSFNIKRKNIISDPAKNSIPLYNKVQLYKYHSEVELYHLLQ